jgi:hypothetical protein
VPVETVRKMRDEGKGPAEIAAALSISRMSVWRALNLKGAGRHCSGHSMNAVFRPPVGKGRSRLCKWAECWRGCRTARSWVSLRCLGLASQVSEPFLQTLSVYEFETGWHEGPYDGVFPNPRWEV